jgi:hypothetical protein
VPAKKWSQKVTETSDALDLEPGIFARGDAKAIAASLKRSAQRSSRRRGTAFQSAMSMLTFYVNRAGKELPKARLRELERAKHELRLLFGKPEPHPRP